MLRVEFEIQIVIRHFPLHPNTPENGLTLEALFAGRDIDVPAVQAQMTRLFVYWCFGFMFGRYDKHYKPLVVLDARPYRALGNGDKVVASNHRNLEPPGAPLARDGRR